MGLNTHVVRLLRDDFLNPRHVCQQPRLTHFDRIGEALTAQQAPDKTVEVQSSDGLLRIRLEPLAADSRAEINTATGTFTGRDHLITITRMEDFA